MTEKETLKQGRYCNSRSEEAGSVVTHGIPAGIIAVGKPSRVLRRIAEEDERARASQD